MVCCLGLHKGPRVLVFGAHIDECTPNSPPECWLAGKLSTSIDRIHYNTYRRGVSARA